MAWDRSIFADGWFVVGDMMSPGHCHQPSWDLNDEPCNFEQWDMIWLAPESEMRETPAVKCIFLFKNIRESCSGQHLQYTDVYCFDVASIGSSMK